MIKTISNLKQYIHRSKALWNSNGSKRSSSYHLENVREDILNTLTELDDHIQWVKYQEKLTFLKFRN